MADTSQMDTTTPSRGAGANNSAAPPTNAHRQTSRPIKNGPPPEGYTIQKRPLPRAPVPKANCHNLKPLYISSTTPFMSIVSRTQKTLDKHARQVAAANKRTAPSLEQRIAALDQDREKYDEVVIHGAGKAMGKALRIAAWFREQKGYAITLRTATVGTVDGVVPVGGAGYDGNLMPTHDGKPKPKGRIRMVSCLEVGVRLV